MKRTLILLFLGAAFGHMAHAQSLINQVPAGAGMVMEINLESVKTNMGDKVSTLDKDMSLSIFKYRSMPFAKLFNSSKSGVSTNKKAYFFMHKGNTYWALPLEDSRLFKASILKLAASSRYESNKKENVAFKTAKGAETLFDKNYGVVIKNNVAILTKGPRIYTYNSYGGNYKLKDALREYLRNQGVTDSDQEVSQATKDKIEELIANHDKKLLEKTKEKSGEIKMEVDAIDEIAAKEETSAEAAEAVEEAAEAVTEEYYEENDMMDVAAEEATEITEMEVPTYRYEWSHPCIQAFDAAWEKYKIRKKESAYDQQIEQMTAQALQFMNQNEQNSILSNNQFTSDFSSTHDMGVWISETFPFQFSDVFLEGTNKMLNWPEMNSLMSGNHGVVYMDVKDQSIDIVGSQSTGEEWSKYRMMNARPVNKKIIKYLPKTTFGLYAMNINQNEIYDMYFDFSKKMLARFQPRRGMEYSAMVDLFDMFINKDMLLNTLSGDAIVALTGTTKMISNKRKYRFDSAAFKRTWQMVPDTAVIPEMMSLFTIKNQANLEKMLATLIKLKVLKKKGKNYFIDMENRNSYRSYGKRKEDPLKAMWTMGIEKDMFFITNSQQVKKNKGLVKHAAKKEMNKEICALLKKEGNFFYWAHETGMNVIPWESMGSKRSMQMALMSAKYFKSAKMVSKQTGKNSYAINASFNFNEQKKENAMFQFLEMVQKMNERF